MSFWKRYSTRGATNRASWSPVFGHTIGDQYSSYSLWPTLESNTWARNIQYTSRTILRKITLWQQNGMDKDTLASQLIGTTKEDKSAYPCQTMSQKLSKNSSTSYNKSNTNHIQVPQSYMEQRISMPLHHQLHHSLIKRARNSFNKSVENSYSLGEQ